MSENGRESGRGTEAKKAQAALLIAGGTTIAEVVAQTGITTRTLFRWRQEPDFKQSVSRIRTDLLESVHGKLATTMTAAADKLAALINHDDPRVALQACKIVADALLKIREQAGIDDRLSALESLMNEGASVD